MAPSDRRWTWTAAVLLAAAPLLITLCGVLWRTPYPLNEAVALFEDVARGTPARFLIPETSYYRPFFHLSLMAVWRHAESLESRLALIKLIHIAPVVLLVLLFIAHLRPRTFFDAAAASAAAAVLVGSQGFRDNLEIPLSYTAVGMPIALMVWLIANRERRAWHAPAIVVLTLIAIGFKEQGLTIIPVVIAAWWTGAPGTTRRTALSLAAVAVAYVAFRLAWREHWPLFEQSMGVGFRTWEPRDAAARFGAFPYWLFAYNSASTIANVLFSEPTRGLFFIVRDISYRQVQTWEIVHLASSTALTSIVAWWGIRLLKNTRRGRDWSAESRLFLVLIVSLLACGALSFDYSRDRLGGMAVVFYALAAFFALRAAMLRALDLPQARFAAITIVLMLVAAGWHVRAAGTIEWVRRVSLRNETGWLTELGPRRIEFADRQVYLRIMESMIDQGANPAAPRPTRYPRWLARTFGPP